MPADFPTAVEQLRDTLDAAVTADWTTRAGDLEWSVLATVDHLIDVFGWYAALVASGAKSLLELDTKPGDTTSNANRLDILVAVSCVLGDVLTLAPPTRRAWHTFGESDTSGFLAMAVDETLVHGYDIATGLNLAWRPDPRLAAHVLARLFPMVVPGDDPWETLLWASGRVDLPGRPRITKWRWEVAPRGN